MSERKRTRIVIVGGGFAGVYAAKQLTKRRRDDIEVELLSDENYFVFQPMLPEVAGGAISATHVVNPIRELIPRARFRLCRVRRIESARKVVLVEQGEGRELTEVPYDHLVFSLGKVSDFSRIPGASEHALGMRTLADAFRLRNHIINCLELADLETDAARRAALLTFVIAGGGFSGVETAGEMHELVEKSLKYFKKIDPKEVRFIIAQSQDRLLLEMPERLGHAAQKILEKRGIRIVTGVRLKAASRDFVYLDNGEKIPCRTFVCTVGNAPNPVAVDALENGGFKRGEFKGRELPLFATDEFLRCIAKEGYWAIGDCAAIPSPEEEGALCPPTAQFAIREGTTCGQNILNTIDGKPLKPFRFKTLGLMASLGKRSGVGLVFGVMLTGFIAWFMWRSVYLSKLPGIGRRIRVALDWTLHLLFPRDLTQLQVAEPPGVRNEHYEPGETIIKQGEVGRELYMVADGEVEIVVEQGGQEKVVATLGRKDVFGERAILQECRRGASVRSVGKAEIVALRREAFQTLIAQFPVLDVFFEEVMRERYPELFPGDTALIAQIQALYNTSSMGVIPRTPDGLPNDTVAMSVIPKSGNDALPFDTLAFVAIPKDGGGSNGSATPGAIASGVRPAIEESEADATIAMTAIPKG